jgi:hypothetical protein
VTQANDMLIKCSTCAGNSGGVYLLCRAVLNVDLQQCSKRYTAYDRSTWSAKESWELMYLAFNPFSDIWHHIIVSFKVVAQKGFIGILIS